VSMRLKSPAVFRMLLEELGLEQRHLARAAACSESFISQMVKQGKGCSPATAALIVQAMQQAQPDGEDQLTVDRLFVTRIGRGGRAVTAPAEHLPATA
jgi:predicted transcriptional regulator